MSQWVDVCVPFGFYMGARVGWRAAEAWARGEDESAIEHHQIKRYLMPALTRPPENKYTLYRLCFCPRKTSSPTLRADRTSEQRDGFKRATRPISARSEH